MAKQRHKSFSDRQVRAQLKRYYEREVEGLTSIRMRRYIRSNANAPIPER